MHTPTVLIADDSPLVLRMIETMLASAGLSVITARDGLEAVEKAFSEDVGLVILDVTMPRMNGYQACRLIKSEPATKGLPVVILTSRDQPGDRFWGLQTGADYYVTKDEDPGRILDLVKQIFARSNDAARVRGAQRKESSSDILSRVNDLLDRKLFEATILTEIGQVARSLVHFDETFTSVMNIVTRVVDFTVGSMAFVDGEEIDLVMLLQRPSKPAVIEEAKQRLLDAVARQRGTSPTGRVNARLLGPIEGGGAEREETQLGGFASYPIVTNGELSGMLALGGRIVSRAAYELDEFLGQVANQAHIVTVNSRLLERLRALSMRDGLTNLYNHRHSIEMLGNEFQRVGRYEGGVCLLMIDIDHFKKVNDEFGHQAGDTVLRETARLMQETLRTVDSLGRYGGEEFVAILPQTTREHGLQTAERLRAAVEGHSFRAGSKELQITVSVGVASYPSDDVDSPGTLVRRADQALYRAKQAGRNRIA